MCALSGPEEPAVWDLSPFTSVGILCLAYMCSLARSFFFTYDGAGTVLSSGIQGEPESPLSPPLPHSQHQDSERNMQS